jgi:sentrin-specific protease 7
LNDNLIDLKIKYHYYNILNDNKENNLNGCKSSGSVGTKETEKRVHAFSSMFYSKLTEPSRNRTEKENEQYRVGHQLVSKWSKRFEVFNMDFIVIPINFSLHWSLAIIVRASLIESLVQKKIEEKMKDSEDEVRDGQIVNQSDSNQGMNLKTLTVGGTGTGNVPCILHLDSLNMHSYTKQCKICKEYLKDEWKAKMSANYSDHEEVAMDVIDKLTYVQCNVPLQVNDYDCGIYIYKFVETLFRKLPTSTPEDIKNQFMNWWNPNSYSPADITAERKQFLEQLKEIRDVCTENNNPNINSNTNLSSSSSSSSSPSSSTIEKVKSKGVIKLGAQFDIAQEWIYI